MIPILDRNIQNQSRAFFGILNMTDFIERSFQLELDMQQQLFCMESIGAKFEEFGRLYDHIATFGIDSTLIRLYNGDKTLDVITGVTLPSCESFELHESPESGLVMAAMEGIGDFFGKIIEFVKNIFKKIWGWIKSIFGFDAYDQTMDQLKQSNEQISKVMNTVSAKANAVPDMLEKAKTKANDKKDQQPIKCRKYLCDVPKLFGEINRLIKRVDGHLNGDATPDVIMPLMMDTLVVLNKETDHNPDNPKFKETIEVKSLHDNPNVSWIDRSRIVEQACLHRISSQKIHSGVKKIQDTVLIYLNNVNKKASSTTGKEAKKYNEYAKEAQQWATLTAKFVSKIIQKTAAAMRLLRVYVREAGLAVNDSGMTKIVI